MLSARSCQGVEHALPDFVRWGVDARGRQRVLHVGAEEGVDVGQGIPDFSDLDVKSFDGALPIAALCEFAASNGPVRGKPPKHDLAVVEFADGIEVLRRETPVDHHRALEPVQLGEEGSR